jgi:DNA replication protein DnaC
MLIHPTIERMHQLGLTGMADAFAELQDNPQAVELSREDWLGLLLDREHTVRDNKRLARRLRTARLRQAATVEDVDFRAPRGLDRGLFCQSAPNFAPRSACKIDPRRWSGCGAGVSDAKP